MLRGSLNPRHTNYQAQPYAQSNTHKTLPLRRNNRMRTNNLSNYKISSANIPARSALLPRHSSPPLTSVVHERDPARRTGQRGARNRRKIIYPLGSVRSRPLRARSISQADFYLPRSRGPLWPTDPLSGRSFHPGGHRRYDL